MLQTSRWILCLTITLTATISIARGPSTGGGGDAVILPDDTVVLADPFLNSVAPQPNNMPPMRALNPRLLQVADSYLRASLFHLELMSPQKRVRPADEYHSDIATMMKALSLRKNNLRFYAVQTQEELNLFCAPGGRKSYTLPTGARVEQVACTAGNETFLVEPLFLRMSLKDQTLLLIHERLTTLRDTQGGKNYSAIARFTTGLGFYLNIYREQQKRNFRKLTPAEQRSLTEFYIAIEEIERRDSDITEDSFQWTAAPTGGGRVHALSDIAEDATIGLGFVVGKNSRIESGAVLKRGTFGGNIPSLIVGENTVLDQVYLNNVSLLKVGAKSSILGSTLSGNIEFGDNAKVDQSEFTSTSLIKFGDDSTVTHSVLNGEIKSGLSNKLTRVKLAGQIEMGDRNTFEKSSLLAMESTKIEDENTIIDSKVYGRLSMGDKITFNKVYTGERGVVAVGDNSTLENVGLYGTTHISDGVAVHQSSLLGGITLKANSKVLNSELSIAALTLKSHGTIENFKIKYNNRERGSLQVHLNIEKLKDGFMDNQSASYYASTVKLKPVNTTWTDSIRFELKFSDLSSSTADQYENYLKGHFFHNEGPLVIQVGSSFNYMPDTLFNDGASFKIKQTKYRIQFNPEALPREERAKAYTIAGDTLVPATGGYLRRGYEVNYNSYFADERLAILKKKMIDLGFEPFHEELATITYSAPMAH